MPDAGLVYLGGRWDILVVLYCRWPAEGTKTLHWQSGVDGATGFAVIFAIATGMFCLCDLARCLDKFWILRLTGSGAKGHVSAAGDAGLAFIHGRIGALAVTVAGKWFVIRGLAAKSS